MCRWSIPSASPRLCVKLLNTDSSPGEWPLFSYYFSCFSIQIKLGRLAAWPCRSSSFLDKDHTASWTWCPSQHQRQVTSLYTAVTNEVIVATMLLESLRLLFAPRLPLDLSGKARIWEAMNLRWTWDEPEMNLRWTWWRFSELEQKLQPHVKGRLMHFLRTFSVSAGEQNQIVWNYIEHTYIYI